MDKFDYSEELLKIAEKDMKASKLLYNHEFYPQSVFYLQQSSEKSIKVLGLLAGEITENDVRSIGHKGMKILEKSLLRLLEFQYFII